MQYIINAKILSLPPYVSTSWDHVCSLHVETIESQKMLVITLKNGTVLRIPGLEGDVLTKIFQTHTQYLEAGTKKESSNQAPKNPNPVNFENMFGFGFPMKIGGATLDGLGAAMQHNPEQANSPDLPKEVLEKITMISKVMDTDTNLMSGLKAEPHCNCTYCQIARAFQGQSPSQEIEEETVSDEDLKFKSWDISQTGEKLYVVTNPLDKKEQYNVFLGEPLGCTCGQKNCEHIKAVLNT